MNLQQWSEEQARLRHEEMRIKGATPEYHEAMKASRERCEAALRAGCEERRYTTGGDFCHLARPLNTVSFRRGPK